MNKTYRVPVSMTFDATVEVRAESEEEAFTKVVSGEQEFPPEGEFSPAPDSAQVHREWIERVE